MLFGNNRRTNVVLQQSDVEEPRENGSRKRSRSGPPPISDSSNEDENPDVRKSGKLRKTDHTTGRGKSEVEDDRMSVHVNDTHDNISELIQNDADESDTASPDETVKGLGEKFEEIEPTCCDVKQKLAEIVEKRWKTFLRQINIASGYIYQTRQLPNILLNVGKS